MTSPLVSVIIPTYNRETLILRAIDSVLRQTYQNFELIVVDDKSTDGTQQVLSSIRDPRLRVLRHSTNSGPPATRNTGINAASGEYLAFLDSDDEWLEQKLEVQLAVMREKDAHFCYCQLYCYNPDGTRTILPQRGYTGGSLLRYLICDGGSMQTSGPMVRKDFNVPFDATTIFHDDWDWVVRIREKTDRFVFVPQPLSHFHTDASVRGTDKEGNALFTGFRGMPLIERVQPFLRKHAAEISAHPCIMRHLACWYAGDALLHGDRELARSILKRYRVYPSLWRKPKAIKLWRRSLLG
jgi:glycosyltransferase involved in cell wall biosynthesis